MGLGLVSLAAPAIADPNTVTVCHAGGTSGAGWEAITFNVNGLKGHDRHPSDIIPPNSSVPGGLNWTNAGKILYIDNCAPLPPGETPPVYPPVIVIPPVVVVDPPVVVVDPPVVVVDPPVVVVDPPVVVADPPVVVADPPAVVVDPPAVVVVDPSTAVEPTDVVDSPAVEVAPPAVIQSPESTTTPVVKAPAAPNVTAPKAAAPKGAVTKAPAAVSRGTNQGFNAQTAVGGSEQNGTWLAGLAVMAGAGAVVAVRRTTRLEGPTAG